MLAACKLVLAACKLVCLQHVSLCIKSNANSTHQVYKIQACLHIHCCIPSPFPSHPPLILLSFPLKALSGAQDSPLGVSWRHPPVVAQPLLKVCRDQIMRVLTSKEGISLPPPTSFLPYLSYIHQVLQLPYVSRCYFTCGSSGPRASH